MRQRCKEEAFRNPSPSSEVSNPSLINFSVSLFQWGEVVVLVVTDNQSQRVQGFICGFAMGFTYPFALYKLFPFFARFLIGKVRRTLPYLIRVVSLGKWAALSPRWFTEKPLHAAFRVLVLLKSQTETALIFILNALSYKKSHFATENIGQAKQIAGVLSYLLLSTGSSQCSLAKVEPLPLPSLHR